MTPFRYRLTNFFVYVASALEVILSGVPFRPTRPAAKATGPRPSRPESGKRIALVSEFFYPTLGGIQDHLFFFSRELIRLGHRPTIITPHVFGAGEFHHWWPKDLPSTIYHPVGHSLPLFINGSLGRTAVGLGLGRQLRDLLTPDHFDLVHLHSPLAGTLPILALANASVPVVGTFHTSFSTSALLTIARPIAQKQLDALSAVIAVSPISLASIRRYFPIDATIIPNGIDTARFRPWWEGEDDRLMRWRDGRVNVFFIGRPDPRNGLDALIRAFARVHAAAPEARLLIAGDGASMRYYRSTVAKMLPAGSVEFLGAVRDDRPALYRTADIQVFGVERAAFSVTILEGMASGLPVITTNWRGHEYMGRAGEHFVTTPFDDDAALERELLVYIKDARKRRDLGERARAHALNYDWTVITERILAIYGDVIRSANNRQEGTPHFPPNSA
jgi:phosphatidylinositol alpha-mannosyltransferase